MNFCTCASTTIVHVDSLCMYITSNHTCKVVHVNKYTCTQCTHTYFRNQIDQQNIREIARIFFPPQFFFSRKFFLQILHWLYPMYNVLDYDNLSAIATISLTCRYKNLSMCNVPGQCVFRNYVHAYMYIDIHAGIITNILSPAQNVNKFLPTYM